MSQTYEFLEYMQRIEGIKNDDFHITHEKIQKDGIYYRIRYFKKTNVTFRDLPGDISTYISKYLIEFIEIEIFLHLFIIFKPIHRFSITLYWEFINTTSKEKQSIWGKIKKRNALLNRKKYVLFYFCKYLNQSLKNLENEIISFITELDINRRIT